MRSFFSRAMNCSGMVLEHWVEVGRRFAQRQAFEFIDAMGGEERERAITEIELRVGSDFAVAHPQENRHATPARKLAKPVQRHVGRFGARTRCVHLHP